MDELNTALDAIHDALMDGEIESIAALTQRLEETMVTMEPLSEPLLLQIREKAARNARMLEAALLGVRSAQRRLVELQEAASGHRIYASNGAREVMLHMDATFRQRV